MKKAVFLFVVALLVAGCATAPKPTEADKTRTYSVGYDRLFDAAKLLVLKRGCEITMADKQGGLLKARKAVVSSIMTSSLFDNRSGMFLYYDFVFLGNTVRAEIYAGLGDGSQGANGTYRGYAEFWEEYEAILATL